MNEDILKDPRFAELSGFTTSKPEFNSLPAGTWYARVVRWEVLTSFDADFNGTQKETEPEWKDSLPQVAVTFSEYKNRGIITHRFALRGFMKMNKLDAETLKKIKAKYGEVKESEESGYVLVKKDGVWIRIKDEEATKKALGILNQLCWALGSGEGLTVKQALDEARDEHRYVQIQVESKEYKGKNVTKVLPNFKPIPSDVVDEIAGIDKDFE